MKHIIIAAVAALVICMPNVARADCGEQVAEHAWKCDPPTRPAPPAKRVCHYYDDAFICNTDDVGQPVVRTEKVIEASNCKWRWQRDKRGVRYEEHYCR